MNELHEIIQKTISGILQLKGPLEKVSTESEPMFVNLGNDLQDIFTSAEYLTSLSRETGMLIDGQSNDNILGNVGEFSRQSLIKLNACKEEVTNVLPSVETCSTNLKRLHDMCPVIKTIAKKLNIVALNISMESSRSRECEEMFNFFVKEIKQLAGKVQEISVRIREGSENARSNQIADLANLSAKRDTLSDLADSAHRTVEENLVIIEDMVKMALEVMQRSEIHSKNISSLVSDVVVAIQFHDIARQQMEHVIQTLEDIPRFFIENEEERGDNDDHRKNLLMKVRLILILQVEQVNQVIHEIRDAYDKTTRSFTEIGKEVETLVMEITGFEFDSDNYSGIGNPFISLLSGLDQLNKIMTQGNEMARVIDQNLKQSAETATDLGSNLTQMEDISMNLHIKAINALIMSKRLGSKGKTLSVLAEDVTQVSMDSNEFVLGVVEILKTIGDLVTSISCISPEAENSLNNECFLDMNLSTGIDMISRVYDDFIKKSIQSAELSKGLKDKITDLESELNFLKEMEKTLLFQLNSIKELTENIESFISDNGDMDDELDHLRARYTMEVERGIHNKTIKQADSSYECADQINSSDIYNQGEPEEDYLGDNIELF